MICETAILEALRAAIAARLKCRGDLSRLAVECGVSTQLIYFYLHDRCKSVSHLLRVAEAIGVQLEVRIDGKDLR